MNLVRYADRPDLVSSRSLSSQVFPKFVTHHATGPRYWNRLYAEFPAFQQALLDGEEVVAEAHAIAIAWDGTVGGLPSGWEATFELGFDSGLAPTTLSMLVISVAPTRQGERLGSRMLEASREAARAAGLGAVLAPVRPTLKDRYPLIPIERYMAWRRPDGSHFDPWLRLHERVGGEILAPAQESLVFDQPLADWEQWTGMAFPEDGEYVVPGMLAPLVVRGGRGRHAEPNVWVRHSV
jgi:ribosomal protein S18 acetylase RimI-like enzyme